MKIFRIPIQASDMSLLWTAQLLIVSIRSSLPLCQSQSHHCGLAAQIQTWAASRTGYTTQGICSVFSRLLCFLQKKYSYLACMHIFLWLSNCQYFLSEEGKCWRPSAEKLRKAQKSSGQPYESSS